MSDTEAKAISRLDSTIATVKADVISASQRAAVLQFVSVAKTALATALGAATPGSAREKKRAQKQTLEFFNSEVGGIVFMLTLGSLIPLIPTAWLGPLGPLTETVCRELRVQGMTEGMVLTSDIVLAPMRAALESLTKDPHVQKAIQELSAAQPVESVVEPAHATAAT